MRVRQFRRTWPTRDRQSKPHAQRLPDAQREDRAVIEAIDQISEIVDSSASLREKLFEIAAIARQVTHTDAAQVFLLSEDNLLRLEADTYQPQHTGSVMLRLGEGLTGWAAANRTPVAIRMEPWKDPRYLEYPPLDERAFQSLLCVPLLADDELLGVVNVRTHGPYGYTSHEANILSRIANQVARAIRQQAHVHQLTTKAARLEAVSEVSGALSQSPYLEEILQLLVSFTAERLNFKVVNVRLLDEAHGELVLRATQSENFAYRRKRSLAIGESFAGKALLTKSTITVRDVTEAREYVGSDLAEVQGLRGMACVPLMAGEKPIGVMTCYTETPHEFTRVEVRALELLAKQAAISIEHAKLQVRDTLMQEMHHRVKNSLQQISSLLRLQMAEGEEKSSREAMQEVLNRISAIASVHDLLSREDLDRVGIIAVAEALASYQQQMMMPPNRQVPITVSGDNVVLGMSQATQIALILNELLQNAVEHGFARAEEGEIHVVIRRKMDEVRLWVSNSGTRLPEDFDLRIDSHLGLKIVDGLAKGIGGKFSLTSRFNWVVAEVRGRFVETE